MKDDDYVLVTRVPTRLIRWYWSVPFIEKPDGLQASIAGWSVTRRGALKAIRAARVDAAAYERGEQL